jgi:hypothetical protein
MAYSTWNNRPCGLHVVTSVSYWFLFMVASNCTAPRNHTVRSKQGHADTPRDAAVEAAATQGIYVKYIKQAAEHAQRESEQEHERRRRADTRRIPRRRRRNRCHGRQRTHADATHHVDASHKAAEAMPTKE